MSDTTEATELEKLEGELSENRAVQEKLREKAARLQRHIERIKKAAFVESFEGGRFEALDREKFTELHALMHSAGQDTYVKGKTLLADIHPAIAYDGGYVSTTSQPIFRLTLAHGTEVSDDLVAAVVRVSEWVAVDDNPVYWSIFDWRLGQDGSHAFFVHSEEEAEIVVTRYGNEDSEGRKPIGDVLRDISARHYYPARDEDYADESW